MKKIILFDIDYTLFNTAAFRQRLYKSIASALGYKLEECSDSLQNIYDEITAETGFFEPKIFSFQLARKLGREKDKVLIEKAIFARSNFKNGLYHESLEVIERLSRIGIVGIFSRGYNSFQRNKINSVKHLLDEKHIHIIIDKHKSLPDILAKYKSFRLYIIDDALDVLYNAWKLRKDVVTIWVKRGRYAMNQAPISGFNPNKVISNLKEAISVIEKA